MSFTAQSNHFVTIKKSIETSLFNQYQRYKILFSILRLSVSVNEDSFQSAERVCDEIENLLLAAE